MLTFHFGNSKIKILFLFALRSVFSLRSTTRAVTLTDVEVTLRLGIKNKNLRLLFCSALDLQ